MGQKKREPLVAETEFSVTTRTDETVWVALLANGKGTALELAAVDEDGDETCVVLNAAEARAIAHALYVAGDSL